MLSIKATIREGHGRKTTKSLRKKGFIPAVLYGAKTKNLSLSVERKKLEDIYRETGESSLISLEIKKIGENKLDKKQVLIHDFSRDPMSGEFVHVDFYHPTAKKEIEVKIPLVFEGESPAVKNLEGTIVKEIQLVEIKGLVQTLPREIKVDVSSLRTLEDKIQIKDLKVPQGVKILREPEEIVALVVLPEKMEEEERKESEKPTEEKLSTASSTKKTTKSVKSENPQEQAKNETPKKPK